MPSLNTIRSIKVTYTSEGADKFRSDAEAAAAAQANLGQATERTATVTELSSRRMLSAAPAVDRVRASVDLAYRAQQQFERDTAKLNRGLQQGVIDTLTYDRTLGLLQTRYDAASVAANRHDEAQRAAAKGALAARIAMEAASEAAARQYQVGINQNLGVRTDFGGADRAADFEAAAAAGDRLRAKYDQLFAASQSYGGALTEINALQRAGIITADLATAARQRETLAYEKQTYAIGEMARATAQNSQRNIGLNLGLRQAPDIEGRGADVMAAVEAQDRLRAKYDDVFAAGQRLAATTKEIRDLQAAGGLDAGIAAAKIQEATDAYGRQIAALNGVAAAQKAAVQTSVNRQTIVPDRGADLAAYGTEMDRLRARYSPLFAVQREYLGQLAEIRSAVKVGALTQVEGSSALQRTKDTFAKQVTDLRAKNGGGLTGNQAQNLGYQVSDVVASLGSGSSVTQVAFQQVPQIAQIFSGPGGASIKGAVTQATEGVSGFLSRITLMSGVLGGVTATLVGGVAAFVSYESSARALERSLSGVGRASGATVAQINALVPAAAAAGNVSTRTAREMAGQYAETGKIGVEMYASLIGTAKDYATSTGQDLTDANKTLAAAFADPAKGAETLNAQLGFLNSTTKESIERLQAQGDRLGAQRALFDAYKGSLSSAAELTTGLGRITSATGTLIADVWDRLGKGLDKSITGGTLEEQVATAQQNLDRARTAQTSRVGAFRSGISGQGVPAAEADLKRLNDLLDERKRKTEAVQVAQRNLEVGAVIRSLLPEEQELKSLQDRVTFLRSVISQPVKFGLDQRGLAEAGVAFERLSVLARNTREDIEKFGDVGVATANRQAEFRNRLATTNANPVEQQIADLRFQYEVKLRERNIDPTATRESVAKPYNDRLADPNLDARELQSIVAAREIALRVIDVREGLSKTLNTEIDTIKKEAETRASRSQTISSYMERVIGGESSGDTNAKNPLSTATGLGQFIEKTWLGLFKERFPERAAGMSDPQILARRTDRGDSIELLKVFTEQNARFLEKASLATTDRNLYLAHFAGAQGAVDLLKADRNASAVSVLGTAAAVANPTIVGGGRTVGNVIDYADRVINKSAPAVRSTDRETAVLRAQATATEQTTEAEARRQKIQDLLNDDLQRGGVLGRTYATAQDLLKASTSQLTPELEAQRKTIIDTAEAYGKAQSSLENSRIGREALFDRAQIGRSQQEQAVASRLRGTGLGMDSAEAGALRLNDNLRETKALATDAFSSMLTDMRQGVSLATSLSNITGRIADKLLSKAADSVMSSLFAGLGSAANSPLPGAQGPSLQSSGFMSVIKSIFGAADGRIPGYADGKMPVLTRDGIVNGPGTTTSDSILARISDREAIIKASSVNHYGAGFIKAINDQTYDRAAERRAPGYAEGRVPGYDRPYAAPAPSMGGAPVWMPAPANAPPPPANITVINNSGAQVEAKEVEDGRGGRRQEIVINEAVAKGISSPQGQGALGQRRIARR